MPSWLHATLVVCLNTDAELVFPPPLAPLLCACAAGGTGYSAHQRARRASAQRGSLFNWAHVFGKRQQVRSA
jgi:hypothetical protein